MNQPVLAILTVAIGFCFLDISAVSAQHGAHVMITPRELKWSDVPSLPPGAKIAVIEGPMNEAVQFTVRIRFPPNYQLPAHWHPAVERVTVLSGTFNMGVGDKLDMQKTTALTLEASRSCNPKPITLPGPKRKRPFNSTEPGPGASLMSTRKTIRERSSTKVWRKKLVQRLRIGSRQGIQTHIEVRRVDPV